MGRLKGNQAYMTNRAHCSQPGRSAVHRVAHGFSGRLERQVWKLSGCRDSSHSWSSVGTDPPVPH